MASQAAEGKKLLTESRYSEAIEQFTLALASSPTSPDYLIQRSTAYQRTKQFTEALHDAEAAVLHAQARAKRELIVQAQLRRGIALFGLERFADAKFVLDIVKSKDAKDKSVDLWLNKVESKLKAAGDTEGMVTISELPDQSAVAVVEQSVKDKIDSKQTTPAKPTAPEATPMEKIRHEWYQSNTSVFVSLLAKGVPKDEANVEITEGSFSISFPVKATGSTYDFTIDPLFAHVDHAKSSYRILSTKIEITLTKATPGQKWATLEGDEPLATLAPSEDAAAVPQAVLTAKGPVYPTSSKSGPKDWDRIANDKVEDDEEGGDDATKFFKQLYKDASPETQRAMMKSYTESNGTALSTDWSEVSKKKVETLPPDGMESKKWQS